MNDEKVFCTSCGAELAEGSKFCITCGTPSKTLGSRPSIPTGKVFDLNTIIKALDSTFRGHKFLFQLTWTGLGILLLALFLYAASRREDQVAQILLIGIGTTCAITGYLISALGVIRMCRAEMLGEPEVTYGEAFAFSIYRLGSVIGAFLMLLLTTAVAEAIILLLTWAFAQIPVLNVATTALFTLLLASVAILFWVGTMLAIAIIGVEDVGAGEVLNRAYAICRSRLFSLVVYWSLGNIFVAVVYLFFLFALYLSIAEIAAITLGSNIAPLLQHPALEELPYLLNRGDLPREADALVTALGGGSVVLAVIVLILGLTMHNAVNAAIYLSVREEE